MEILDSKKLVTIDVEKLHLLRYGGTSCVFFDSEKKNCYKLYRPKTLPQKREMILENLKALDTSIDSKSPLVLPSEVYLNDQNLIEMQKMPFVHGFSGVNAIRSHYMKKQYLILLKRIIEIVKEVTRKGLTVTDLKLSNIAFDRDLVPKIIDNDYTLVVGRPEPVVQSIYNRLYSKLTQSNLDPTFNIYGLYFMIAMLLLKDEELEKSVSTKTPPTLETLQAINYYIQTNRGIPQSFKMELRNLFTLKKEIDFSDKVTDEVLEFVAKQIRRN